MKDLTGKDVCLIKGMAIGRDNKQLTAKQNAETVNFSRAEAFLIFDENVHGKELTFQTEVYRVFKPNGEPLCPDPDI